MYPGTQGWYPEYPGSGLAHLGVFPSPTLTPQINPSGLKLPRQELFPTWSLVLRTDLHRQKKKRPGSLDQQYKKNKNKIGSGSYMVSLVLPLKKKKIEARL